jgi:hypothetical protein
MIEQDALKWPYIALMRYQIVLGISHILEQYDFTFYFNGNTEFLSKVSKEDLLPLEANQKITLYLQPHVFHKNRNKYPTTVILNLMLIYLTTKVNIISQEV